MQSVSTSSKTNRKIAVLRDRLFVPGEFVTEEMLDAYKSPLVIGMAPKIDPMTMMPETDPITQKVIQEPIIEIVNHYQINYLSADNIVYSFNRGDVAKMKRLFHDFEIMDERVSTPMKAKLKIRFPEGKSWREYQPDAIDALLNNDSGLLKAPPRSGKTLMIAGTVCLEREKSIIFAHQTDLLVQLYDTFMSFTNLPDLQTPGDPVVGFAESLDDFYKLDVVLCTKQTFDHINNKPMLAIIQKLFGSVWVDEAHFLAAEMYSKTLNRFWAKTRRGVTATPRRKDGYDVVTTEILGPTIHTITPEQVKQVPMEVLRINTGVKLSVKDWTKIQKNLSESERRNQLIVGHMLEDVRKGHTIIAVTDRKNHQSLIKKMLKEHGVSCEVFNGDLGSNREVRKRILNRLREREVPILIAMRNMTTGLDIPRADMFYNLLPSSNAVRDGEDAGEGGYEQQCTRVRTDFPGKTKCWTKDFVDNFGISYSCWNERRKTYDKIGAYIVPTKDEKPEFEMMHMDDGLGGVG